MPIGGKAARSAAISENVLKLVAVDERRGERAIALDSLPLTIGSADSNDVVVAGESVSPMHARIRWAFGQTLIEDMGSTAGTFLNGERLARAHPLKPGDRLEIGGARFELAIASTPARRLRRWLKVGAALASVAGAGYLAFIFATNWNLLQQADSAPALALARAATAHPAAAVSAAGARATPSLSEPPRVDATASANPLPAPSASRAPVPATSRSAVAKVVTGAASVPQPYPGMGTLEDYMKPAPAPALTHASTSNPVRVREKPSALRIRTIYPAALTPWTDAQVKECSDHSKVLAALNSYRGAERLSPVVEDAALSKADAEHGLYLERRYGDDKFLSAIGANMHDEEPGSPGYTPEGKLAAKRSDVAMERFPKLPEPRWSVDGWMSQPFHRVSLLNPELDRIGFGQSCDPAEHFCVAVLNVIDGDESKDRRRRPLAHPILYPSPDLPLHQLAMLNEWPNPLSSCPGYEDPVGVPITIQLGQSVNAKISSYSLVRSGNSLAACAFDETSYVNPIAYDQQHARDVLSNHGTVVIVPREPLEPGVQYSVSAVVNGHEIKWSFSTAPDATMPPWLHRKAPATASR